MNNMSDMSEHDDNNFDDDIYVIDRENVKVKEIVHDKIYSVTEIN